MVSEDGFIELKRTYSRLYEKYSYRAPIDYCVNRIYEYDIKSANISVLRSRKYLPKKELDRLSELPKLSREKAIGLMIRENKKIGTVIKKGIFNARQKLFEANGIQDGEVLSIKNDAVFIIGRRLRVTKFGHIEFVLKNSFTAYHLINGIEFYYDGKNDKFTVKGIADEVVSDVDHENGILKFLGQVIRYLSFDRKDDLRRYLIEFTDQYKSRKLPHQYYKELNAENVYRSNMEISYKESEKNVKHLYFNYADANDNMIDDLNINFNYLFYVLPLIRLHL